MASEPKPPEGRRWLTIETVRPGEDWCHPADRPDLYFLATTQRPANWSKDVRYSRAIEPTCPHCAAKDAEITQWKEAHDDRVDQYRELEVERDAKDLEIERLKAEHAVAIQQARREVLELVRREFAKTTGVVTEMRIEQAFAAKWPEVVGGEKEAKRGKR